MAVEVVRLAALEAAEGAVLLAQAESVHRQLRPQLRDDYGAQMREVFADGGEMCIARAEGRVVGLAVFRVFANTNVGRRFYVDDLVTDEGSRSRGIGRHLLAWLEAEAASRGCTTVELESGTGRGGAHRFYFRERFAITAFSFRKTVR
jgi:GNAT superfamily N-acetyltransferase